MKHAKKLIEVALPLDAINKACAREKSIRHGHPSTLHLWWARRPLAAARAVIFAQMVDDPSAHPDLFPTAKSQEKERQRLFKIIEDLVLWENTTNEKVLQAARDEIWQSWRRACAENADHPRAKELFDRHKLPAFHDPFAGGGALPLEAQRLGLEAFASDLNPVAVLINKAMIEIPPKFAGKPPVNPEARAAALGAQASRLPFLEDTWRSRDYLPHIDSPGLIQSITFRLADSLPQGVLDRWSAELADKSEADRQTAREQRIAQWLDQGHGACHLQDRRIAELVEDALLHFDGERYRLLAWCIMPNHVHVLIETVPGHGLDSVLHSWKSFTAKEANRLLERTGPFWQVEYHDRFIRDDAHFANATRYIENNPVKAGLVTSGEDWRWSSAWKGRKGQAGRLEKGQAGRLEKGQAGRLRSQWGAQGLAADVRYYGQWMRDEAEKRIGHLYPKIEITAEMVAGSAGVSPARPDLDKYAGRKLTVIAWLWARTVKSPNPAFAQVDVPLASTFMLSTKAGKEAYVEPVITGSAGVPPAYHFTVKVGKPKDAAAAKSGTSAGKRAAFKCVMSGTPLTYDYIRAEGQAGRMGARLMAIVAEGERGRVYLAPTPEHEAATREAKPEWKPEVEICHWPGRTNVVEYGLTRFADLFTPRQLVALTTFSDLVQEARERVQRDALAAGLPDDNNPLRDGGTGATAYAEAVGVYLAFALSKQADLGNSLCGWEPIAQCPRHLFGRQAIPMIWDYAEGNPLGDSSGAWLVFVDGIVKAFAKAFEFVPSSASGLSQQADAGSQVISRDKVVSTDPPYYDNIGYADLSDFFYVWLRRSLRPIFPDLFATLAVPKAEELVATPYRHGSKEKAETFFLDGMTQAMHRLTEQAHLGFPVTIYYAFKQSESDGADGTASTGWETFLDAVIRAGFAISGTWPMRTEGSGRMIARDTNALASSIVLVCRPRAASAATATRREFVTALKAELPQALRHLQGLGAQASSLHESDAGGTPALLGIAPVDLAQAAIGPGMAVYTRYAKVLDAEGKVVSVREALALINQTLDETLASQEGDFDADSRWALTWFEQSGFAEGEYGVAEQLSKSKNTSVAGMVEAGILESKRGKVRLLRPEELAGSAGVPPASSRQCIWFFTHRLIRVLEAGGESAAAELLRIAGETPALPAEIARELAYRLYTLCERKKRAAEALAYNGLVQSWPEITRLAREGGKPKSEQGGLFGEPEE